jgi:NADPH:quinone reductase-like Zn-dependent oxidoreductase
MNTLKKLLASETIKPHIFKTFSFDEMSDAHLQVESSRTVGKVIVVI